ncbi:MAG: lysozyme [Alphaproteobacteria bacterium GM202ARS2]|nr:lysozyme [Alphaproteobacteria bacterium GM202ARS2]
MTVSDRLLNRIKEFEGFAPRAKWDYKQYSVGYGTRALSPNEQIDRATADQRLRDEVAKAARIVDRAYPNIDPVWRDRLTSLTYNAGANWVDAGLGRALRQGRFDDAKRRFLQYNRADGRVLPGLVRRRRQELAWTGSPGTTATSPALSIASAPAMSASSVVPSMPRDFATLADDETRLGFDQRIAAGQEPMANLTSARTSGGQPPAQDDQITEQDLQEWFQARGIVPSLQPTGAEPQGVEQGGFMAQLQQNPFGQFQPDPTSVYSPTEEARQRGPFGPENPAMGQPQPTAELRTTTTPFGDVIAQNLGTEFGPAASAIDRALQTAAPYAAEVTGIPGVMRGAEAAGQGTAEGDPLKVAGGAVQAGVSALPYAGPAGRAAMATVPRMMGTAATGTAAGAAASGALSPDQAQAGDEASQPSPLQQLYSERAGILQQLRDARDRREAQRPPGRKPSPKRDPLFTAANNEVRELEQQKSTLDARIQRLEHMESPEYKREQAAKERSRGFIEKNPEIAALLPAAGLAVGAGVPAALRGLKRAGTFSPGSEASRFARDIRRTENALMPGGDKTQAAVGARALQNRLAETAPPTTTTGRGVNALLPGASAAGTGGVLSAEAQLLPDQIDRYALEPGSPEQVAAEERSQDPSRILKAAIPGFAAGLSGYKIGGAVPMKTADRAKAGALVSEARKRGLIDETGATTATRTRQGQRKGQGRKQEADKQKPSRGRKTTRDATTRSTAGTTRTRTLSTTAGPGKKPASTPPTPGQSKGRSAQDPLSTVAARRAVVEKFAAAPSRVTPRDLQDAVPGLTAKRAENTYKKLSELLNEVKGDAEAVRRLGPKLLASLAGAAVVTGASVNALMPDRNADRR